MDNAEAVARLVDVDHSSVDTKDGSHHTGNSKIPLDAQPILDGAYSELVQSGKVKAGKGTLSFARSLFCYTLALREKNYFFLHVFVRGSRPPDFFDQNNVKLTPVTARRVPFFNLFPLLKKIYPDLQTTKYIRI